MMDSPRLETLEIKCAHLERAVQELSDVVYRQQQQLDRVLQRNQDLAAQVEALEAPRTRRPVPGPRFRLTTRRGEQQCT